MMELGGLRLLEEFLAECAADGYASDSLMGYRSACRHVLAWIISRASR